MKHLDMVQSLIQKNQGHPQLLQDKVQAYKVHFLIQTLFKQLKQQFMEQNSHEDFLRRISEMPQLYETQSSLDALGNKYSSSH